MFRALPPLVAILLIYFGLPNVGINLPSFAVLWLVLSFVLAAFAEEIFWAGITSTPQGPMGGRALDRPDASRRRSPTSCCRRRSASACRRSPTAPSPSPRTPRSAPSSACREILNQATTAQSFTGNATPLMMGAIAYIDAVRAGRRRSAAGSRRASPGGGPERWT